ncbi:hypothetical protein [Cellulosimicrobium sp. NPDC057127]|uniref:hypothetical protein n=1 Tax=Cellulosimicrobium sp. NPDC057127 TaxID=3346026 RepID=UPI003629852F
MRIRNTISTTTTALATSALLVLGLAACGSDGESDAATEETASAEVTEESPAEEDPAEESPAEETEADGETADVCAATESLESLSTEMTNIDQNDPQAAIDTFEELTATLEGVEPPAEIADDWSTMATSFRTVTDGLSGALADPSSPEAMTKVSEAMSAMSDASFQEAAQNVGAYTTANC